MQYGSLHALRIVVSGKLLGIHISTEDDLMNFRLPYSTDSNFQGDLIVVVVIGRNKISLIFVSVKSKQPRDIANPFFSPLETKSVCVVAPVHSDSELFNREEERSIWVNVELKKSFNALLRFMDITSTINETIVLMAQSHLIINQDLKPVLSAQQQLQQHQQQLHMQQQMQARFYNSQSHLQHMPTSQTSLNFQYAGPTSSINSNINQRSSTTAQTNPSQRQQFYMTRPPPEYQASIEPNNTSISSLKSVLSQNAQMHNSINVCNDQSSRNMELRNFNASKSYSSMMPTSQILSNQHVSHILTYHLFQLLILVPLNFKYQISNNKSYSDDILSNSTTSRPFAGLSQNSSAISMSKSLQDSISMSNASVLTGKSYPSNASILNPLSVSLPKPFVDPSLNNMSTSKSYQRRMANSNLTASQPYAVSSGTLLGQSQMMPVTTVTSTYTSSRGTSWR
ncbi:uncharacterized protein CEXT_407521 [Caerostris extrusa]|uniref:Uncharacterized protein n=1 Tax=Caerostris extrusa TaxID=172846 RepID=A0AAV4QX02_CAEEX|nr:uncharacterized protein CEXT_407521 [Caerostris extrusa]